MNGIITLRSATANWSSKANTATIAQDLGLPTTALDDFIAGKGNLTADALNKLANYIFAGAARYDGETDTLVHANNTTSNPLCAEHCFPQIPVGTSYQPGPPRLGGPRVKKLATPPMMIKKAVW